MFYHIDYRYYYEETRVLVFYFFSLYKALHSIIYMCI